ncbi:MAG TPA: TetR/AcrR family transcriptional regulator [Sphingomicrobium sp.]|jgi:AcrR family transcriptional regulator|nr:TetR/AcrR family transcriptional regulator [Sphingomicrobium sp.]
MARVRTEEKRDEIVRIAAELFEKHGYDRCSMAALSERLGGSKATLYGYFPSKEDLLRAVIQCEVATEFDRILHEFNDESDLRDWLIKLGIAYQRKRLSSLPVANIRSIVNQPPGSTMGKEFYETIIRPAFASVADQFERLMDEGRVRRADPWVVLMHWKGLNDWDLFERRLIGAICGPEDVEIRKVAVLAADAFLKLYGIEEKAMARTPNKSAK